MAYSQEQASALWQQGSLSPQAYYWKEGMPEWRPAAELFGPATVPLGASAVAVAAAPARGFAKDPTTLTKVLQVMLWMSLSGAALGVVTSAISLATGNAAKSVETEINLHDIVSILVGLFQFLVFVVTGVTFLKWIHRANFNARALGAQGMVFTPGWSVGWYFIPFANLWKPFQAMKEIWQASQNPASWPTQPVPSLLTNWWTLWLATNFLGQLSFRLALHANTPQALTSAAVVDLLSDVAHIALCLVALRLVLAIYQNQCRWAGQSEVC